MRAQMHANIDANVEAKPLTLNVGLVPVPNFGTSTNALRVTGCLYFSTGSVALVRTPRLASKIIKEQGVGWSSMELALNI